MEPVIKLNKYEAIKAIINTINTMDIKGYNNCSAVVGCIQYLNKLQEKLEMEDQETTRRIETLMKKIAELEGTDENADGDH